MVVGCLVFGEAVFFVESVHQVDIDEDEDDEDVNRALLREPKAEFGAADSVVIHLVDKQDAEAVANNEPDGK